MSREIDPLVPVAVPQSKHRVDPQLLHHRHFQSNVNCPFTASHRCETECHPGDTKIMAETNFQKEKEC